MKLLTNIYILIITPTKPKLGRKYSIFNVPSLFKPKIIEGHRSGGIKSFYRKLRK